MLLQSHREIMEFLWIIISATICLLLRDSHAKDSDNMKRNSEMFCPSEWHPFGQFCYRGFPNKKDFEKAEKECVKQGGNLATITSTELQDFVTAEVLLPLEHRAYIGLRFNQSTKRFHWTDGSDPGFFAWDANEPSGTYREKTELCVEMRFNNVLKKLGKWNDVSCTVKQPYICEKLKDPQTTKPEEEPDDCSWTLHSTRFRKSCFHFSLHLQNWEDAEKYCVEEYNGQLASITDPAVQKFLHYKVVTHPAQPSSLWIGLQLQPDEVALWSSGWYMGYANWRDKKEKHKVSSKSCASMTREGNGGWTLGFCDEKLPFICEVSPVIPPPKFEPTVPGLKCPSDEWIDLGGDHCYIFNTETPVSWHHASFFCLRKDGTLASIHSRQEEEIIGQFFRLSNVAVYIGLYRHDRTQQTYRDSEWEWIDGSPLDYQNWRPGEPNSKDEMCSETVPSQDMVWNDMNCDTERLFACSVAKRKGLGASTLPDSTEELSSDSEKEESGCISTPAVVGLVLGVLVIISLLGVVLYNVKPWMKARRKESNSRKPSFVSHRPQSISGGEMVISENAYEDLQKEIYDDTVSYAKATSLPT